jgi:DNA-binding NarL/FixJ family response regulator
MAGAPRPAAHRLGVATNLTLRPQRQARGLCTLVINLTASPDCGQVVDAVDLENRGLVLKDLVADCIMECIKRAVAGVQWIEGAARGLRHQTSARPDRKH